MAKISSTQIRRLEERRDVVGDTLCWGERRSELPDLSLAHEASELRREIDR